MSETADKPSIELDEPPNLPPGPTEQGGHGGMATQEQEARICWSKALEARPELAQGYFETAK